MSFRPKSFVMDMSLRLEISIHAMVSTVMHFLLTNLTSPECGLKLGVAGGGKPVSQCALCSLLVMPCMSLSMDSFKVLHMVLGKIEESNTMAMLTFEPVLTKFPC
uniref:Uncharacterized protein n=1 Tax=Zea mays TaxID=4577 RepID=A0A804NK07_MAIZE